MSLQSLDRALSKTSDRSVGDIVAAYGSNIQKLKMDAAAGKIDPTKAVMAMMTIQRIVAANTQPPSGTTVAQDTGIAPPPQQMMPPSAPPPQQMMPPSAPPPQPMMPPPAAPQQAPVRMAYGGQVAVSNNQVPSPAMERGLSGLPVPDNMFDYAEGGMIAFGDGGDVKRFNPGGAALLQPKAVSSYPYNPVYAAPPPQQIINPNALLEYPTRPGGPAIFGSGADPTGYKYFNRDISKLAPYLSELEIERLYQRFAGNVSKAVNFLKSLGPTAGAGIASLAVEQATGLSPADQLLAGFQAGNPALSIASRMMGIQPTPAKKEKDTKDEKGRTSTAEFYKNVSPETQRFLDLFGAGKRGQIPTYGMTPGLPNLEAMNAVDAAVEAAKRNKPAEAPAATPTAPRQEERRGPALSPTVPALPYIGSGQTGDFAVSPEERARNLVNMSGLPKVEALTDEQALQRIKDIEAKSGVDPDFFKKIQGRIDTMREEAKTDKKEAANLRIVEAGLGILGGTSPYAFVNIGKGASEAVKGFGQDLKEYQKARRELDKAEMDLRSAEQNAARTKSNTAINLVERRQEQVNAAKTKEAELYTSGVKAFADLGEQAKGRVSRENIAMAQLQASRDETIARIAQSDRQIAESRAARLEAAGMAADQRFVDGLMKAENNATKSYDAQIETIQKSLSNPAVAITPDFVKEQEAKVSRLIQQKEAAARLARNQYMKSSASGRPTQSNKFPGFVDLTGKQ